MRFVVDHCVPAEAARWLASEGHQAWTAYDAGLADAATIRAATWPTDITLPDGRVLRITKVATPRVLDPRPLH